MYICTFFKKLNVLFAGLVIVSLISSKATFFIRSGAVRLFSNVSVELVVIPGVLISKGVFNSVELFTVIFAEVLILNVINSAILLQPVTVSTARRKNKLVFFIENVFLSIVCLK